MTATHTDTNPRILIKGYEVIVENCTDAAEARALVEQRICDIQKRLSEMKAEKTLFNRHKHILGRWLHKQIKPLRTQHTRAWGTTTKPFTAMRSLYEPDINKLRLRDHPMAKKCGRGRVMPLWAFSRYLAQSMESQWK